MRKLKSLDKHFWEGVGQRRRQIDNQFIQSLLFDKVTDNFVAVQDKNSFCIKGV